MILQRNDDIDPDEVILIDPHSAPYTGPHSAQYLKRLERYAKTRIEKYRIPSFNPHDLDLRYTHHREALSRAFVFFFFNLNVNCTLEHVKLNKNQIVLLPVLLT